MHERRLFFPILDCFVSTRAHVVNGLETGTLSESPLEPASMGPGRGYRHPLRRRAYRQRRLRMGCDRSRADRQRNRGAEARR